MRANFDYRRNGLFPILRPCKWRFEEGSMERIPRPFIQEKKLYYLRTFLFALALTAMIATARAQISGLSGVDGTCDATSHLAEGAIGEDLTKRQSRFFCDIALINQFDDNPNHIMIQFTDRKSHYGRILGFAGLLDGNVLVVDHFYLDDPGHPITPDVSMCKFFSKGKKMTGIWCAAKIDDERGRRTSAMVDFKIR
jgi:hypothetical protein